MPLNKRSLVLPETVSDSVDREMDAQQMNIDVQDIPLMNGFKDGLIRGKRKARKLAIKEESDGEAVPKVSCSTSVSILLVANSIARVKGKK